MGEDFGLSLASALMVVTVIGTVGAEDQGALLQVDVEDDTSDADVPEVVEPEIESLATWEMVRGCHGVGSWVLGLGVWI